MVLNSVLGNNKGGSDQVYIENDFYIGNLSAGIHFIDIDIRNIEDIAVNTFVNI